MQISSRTLKRLSKHVTGDLGMTPYRSGPRLVELFNDLGFDDEYGQGFPSRWVFAEEKLNELNGKPELRSVIEQVFDPLDSQEKSVDIGPSIEDINRYLQRDNLEVTITPDGRARVSALNGKAVEFQPPIAYEPSSREFIEEHVEKCERKLASADYRGAISNARSLCEEVLCDVERQVDPNASSYDGDLPKLYKRVRKLLKMDPGQYKDRESVLILLSGLTTIVNGLAEISNALGDRHGGGSVTATEHHARLAVSCANTLCTYVVSSFVHQNLADW